MLELIRLLDRIPEFDLDDDISETKWADWLMNFKTIMAVIFDDLPERKKVSSLASKLLPGFTPVFKALGLDLEQVKFEELVVSLTEYFTSVNTRMTLYGRVQRKEESFDEFAKNLDVLSLTCGYGSERLSIVRDMFIFNLNPKHADIQKRILQEAKLTLKETVDFANLLLRESGGLSNSFVASPREPRRSQETASGVRRSNPASDVESNGAGPRMHGKGSRDGQHGSQHAGPRHSLGEMNGNTDDRRSDSGKDFSKPNDFRRPAGGRGRQENEVKNSRIEKVSEDDENSRSGRGSFTAGHSSEVDVSPKGSISGKAQQGKSVTANVTFVDPSGLVHVCLAENFQKLQDIHDAIDKSKQSPIKEARSSFRCATKFGDMWCRVKILNVVHGKNEAHVLFYDWGNESSVPVSELVFLPDELISDPHSLSFPIKLAAPEEVNEGDLVKVILKKRDESGVCIAELEQPDVSGASGDKFGPRDDGFRQGGSNDLDERGNRGKFGPTGDGFRQSGSNANGERDKRDKFEPANGGFHQGGSNEDGGRGNRKQFGPTDSRFRQGGSIDGGARGNRPSNSGSNADGGRRNHGKFERTDGGFRQGGPNADGGRGNRDKFGPMDGRFRQGGSNDDGARGNREKFGSTDGGFRQGGSNADGGRGNPDKLGSTNGGFRKGGPSADGGRGHRDKVEPAIDSRRNAPNGGMGTRHSSGSTDNGSRQGGPIASRNRGSRGSLKTNDADPEVPDIEKLSIDGQTLPTTVRRPRPPPIPSGKPTGVRVIYVGAEGAFATPIDDLSKVDKIVKTVEALATTAGPGIPEVDSIVAAPFFGLIYRAKILSVDPKSANVRVSFVDFGNEADVSFDDLLALPPSFANDVHTFKFRLDSFDQALTEGDELTVLPIALDPDGAWVLQVDGHASPSDPALPDLDDHVQFQH